MKPNNSPLGLLYFSIPCFDEVEGKRNSRLDHKNLASSFSGDTVDWALVEISQPGKSFICFALKKADPYEMEEESEIRLDDYSEFFLF